jgi:hypothetical protein
MLILTNQIAWCHNMDKLDIFGNNTPRKISCIKKQKIREQLNLLHTDLKWTYCSADIKVMESRRLQCVGREARIVEARSINMGQTWGNLLESSLLTTQEECRVANIKVNLREVGCEAGRWNWLRAWHVHITPL